MLKIIIIMFVLGVQTFAFANTDFDPEQEKEYIEIDYKLARKESFQKILKKFLKKGARVNKSTGMIDATFNKNPHIKNFKRLKKGQEFVLYLDRSLANKFAIKKFLARQKKLRLLPVDLVVQTGQAEVTANDDILGISFFKIGGSYGNSINENWGYSTAALINNMLSIDLNTASESATAYFYPEFRGSVYRKLGNYVAGAAFSTLYYLVLDKGNTSASLTPQLVYRPAGFFAYFLNDKITIPATAGYLIAPGGGGIDYSVGIKYKVSSRYTVGGGIYSLDLPINGVTEQSRAWSFSVTVKI